MLGGEGGRYGSVGWVSKSEHGYTYQPWPWSFKIQGENVQVVQCVRQAINRRQGPLVAIGWPKPWLRLID